MIPGAIEITQIFNVLVDLEIIEKGLDIGNAANYAIAYSPKKVNMPESSGTESLVEEMTEEEMKIMSMCDKSYENWYTEKVLLEDTEEE